MTKVKSGHGLEADEYELSLAPADALVANDRRLAAGKIYSIRPVFRALGPVAALAYESIEKTPARADKPSPGLPDSPEPRSTMHCEPWLSWG